MGRGGEHLSVTDHQITLLLLLLQRQNRVWMTKRNPYITKERRQRGAITTTTTTTTTIIIVIIIIIDQAGQRCAELSCEATRTVPSRCWTRAQPIAPRRPPLRGLRCCCCCCLRLQRRSSSEGRKKASAGPPRRCGRPLAAPLDAAPRPDGRRAAPA